MDDQPEFDRLRQTCFVTLQLFIDEARKTELHLQQLSVPVSLATGRQLSNHRKAEIVAIEKYLVASTELDDFLWQHLYIVN